MSKSTLGKLNRMELRVYEILGIKLFRRVVLLFENIKHSKDGSRNENYHPQNTSVNSLESFSGYLLYNAMLHIVSILLAIVYFAVGLSLRFNYLWADILMYCIVVFNLYCIMLQRYIYLKMKFYMNRAIAKREHRIQIALNNISSFIDEKESNEFREEYDLIQKIFHSISTGNDCVLGADCTETLNRLAIVAERTKANIPQRVKTEVKEETVHRILSGVTGRTKLVGRVERMTSDLQKILKRPETSNVQFGYSFITETPKCEEAFCRLFPIRTRDKVEFTIVILLTAYQQKGPAKQ